MPPDGRKASAHPQCLHRLLPGGGARHPDSRTGLHHSGWPTTGSELPLAIYLLYNYISQLSRDLVESAFIDGASHFTVFVRLELPLSMPALAAFAIFQFLWVWNDLLVALDFLGTDSQSPSSLPA